MNRIRDLIRLLEQLAPPGYQEDYDNAGLIVGNPDTEIRGVLVCLDATEEVLQEAIHKGCNVIVAHHPAIFKGLKKITGATYTERAVILAIRNELAIYAIHTNLDNMYHQGVNAQIAARLGLLHTSILAPKTHWQALNTTIENRFLEPLQQQLRAEGFPEARQFAPGPEGMPSVWLRTDPARMPALRALLEKITGQPATNSVAMPTLDTHPGIGAGLIGVLPQALPAEEFLDFLKTRMNAQVVRHTAPTGRLILTVALCGGAGSFLLRHAIAKKADAFVSADFKYHEFFDANQQILIADIGHYESEQFTTELLQQIISQNFCTFAAYCTQTITNPVFYR